MSCLISVICTVCSSSTWTMGAKVNCLQMFIKPGWDFISFFHTLLLSRDVILYPGTFPNRICLPFSDSVGLWLSVRRIDPISPTSRLRNAANWNIKFQLYVCISYELAGSCLTCLKYTWPISITCLKYTWPISIILFRFQVQGHFETNAPIDSKIEH